MSRRPRASARGRLDEVVKYRGGARKIELRPAGLHVCGKACEGSALGLGAAISK